MLRFTRLFQRKIFFILFHTIYMTVMAHHSLANEDFTCDKLIKHQEVNNLLECKEIKELIAVFIVRLCSLCSVM